MSENKSLVKRQHQVPIYPFKLRDLIGSKCTQSLTSLSLLDGRWSPTRYEGHQILHPSLSYLGTQFFKDRQTSWMQGQVV